MRKHKLVVLIISIVGVCLPMTFSYFNNYQLNNRHILLSNTGKIDICGDQIFNCDGALTYTQSVALFDAPSKTDILSFLLSHVVNHQYDNVINDLLVPNYDQKATSVTITTKQYSQMYLGQIVVNWTFNQLVDLSTVITNTNLYSDPDTAV
jgi:hypothetical protein